MDEAATRPGQDGPARTGGATLHDRLGTRDNGLNFVRLVLAGLVIVSHTWSVGGFGTEPTLGDLNLGSWAVAGFFAISGYLVTGSRMRLSFAGFARRRAARIFPGFWVCLVVVAFGFVPLAGLAAGTSFDLARSTSFVWANATTLMVQQGVGNELANVPYPGIWNASAWTLVHELTCYVLVGAVLGIGWARRHVVEASLATFAVVTFFNVGAAHAGITRGTMLADFLHLGAYFAAGSLLWALGDRVRVGWWQALACIGLLAAAAAFGVVDLVGALPLAYLALALGASSPLRWGATNDLSYGVYVYAWPVQQLLVLWGFIAFGPAAFIAAAVALVVPLAWLSWTFVERPALKLGRGRRRPPTIVADDLQPSGSRPA